MLVILTDISSYAEALRFLSIYLSFCYLTIHLSLHLFIIYLSREVSPVRRCRVVEDYLSYLLSIGVSIYLCIYLSVYLSVYLSIFASIYFLSIWGSVARKEVPGIEANLYIYYLSVYLSIYLGRCRLPVRRFRAVEDSPDTCTQILPPFTSAPVGLREGTAQSLRYINTH